MPASAEYVARETAANLWRNRLMTIASVLTVAVSLALVGSALLLRQGASNASVEWQRGIQVAVFMRPDATQSEIQSIGVQLAQSALVTHPCVFRDHQWDWNEFNRLQHQVVVLSGTTPAQVPTSWRCIPAQPNNAALVQQQFEKLPGVQAVQAPIKTIHTQETVINVIKYVLLGVAVVLLASAIVLILNTIRMAIFARRREVSVMKLVGATNWFIRVPFMSEGLVEGLLGSGLAASLVLVLHLSLDHYARPSNILGSIEISGWDVFVIDVVVVLIGAAIGTLGSFIAIRRFLDV